MTPNAYTGWHSPDERHLRSGLVGLGRLVRGGSMSAWRGLNRTSWLSRISGA